MIDPGLPGRVVLVTGGNHGIGAATAGAFADQGASVFIQYLRLSLASVRPSDNSTPGPEFYRLQQAKSAEEVVQEIRQRGGRADSLELDLSYPDAIPTLFDAVERAFGHVDILVNNAAECIQDTLLPVAVGSSTGVASNPITSETIDRNFAVNARAVALMMAEFSRRHVARSASWGRIINVSTDGAAGFPGEVSYGASKYAMESYSTAAATEVGRYGITVNVVSPGPIQTGYITAEVAQREVLRTPLGRIGQPSDVADVIVFLASEQARWLTGQRLYVGGGHRMPG